MDVEEKEDMAKSHTGKPYPPRWAMIYMLVLVRCLLVRIILAVTHGDPPWYRHR